MDIHRMMESPWTYVVGVALLVLVIIGMLVVRVAGERAKAGEDQPRDRRPGPGVGPEH